jgi:centrosomal CEP192-like protein/HYDIN/CFA65/VesB family protein
MLERAQLIRLCGLAVLLFVATTAWSDTMTGVTSKTGQGSNDSVLWSQLGADATVLGTTVSVKSGTGVAVNVSFAGVNSLASAVCAASPTCSWSGTGFAAGDRIIWTADAAAGGNGPVSLSFGTSVSGAGALIQADEPGQFVAQIQAFNGSTLLGSFSVTSNASGDAVYVGILDKTGPNITSVTFSLTACGSADANCVFSDFGLDTVFLNVGSGSSTTVTLTPTSLTFGTVAVGVTSPVKKVTLKNSGAAALAISSIAITGTNSTDFVKTATTCGSSLAVNATCTISVDFKPAATGARSADLSITDNATGSPQMAPLSGTGTTAKFAPASLGFGDVAIGVSATKVITLTNIGTTALSITAIAITGTNAADFGQTHTCGASLAAGAKCTFSITFSPSVIGARSASLSVTNSAAGSPQLIPLTGVGTTAKLAPTSLNFGSVTVGTTTAAKTITLTNIGTTALTITSIALTGTGGGDYLQTHTCGASLAAGASCSISVQFKPTVTGARSAVIKVADNAAGSPQQVPLSGKGI